MMICEPWLAGPRCRLVLVFRLARRSAQAMNDQKSPNRKEKSPNQANQPVRSILLPVNEAQRSALDRGTCEQKRQPEKRGFPAVDCGSALCRMVQQHGRHSRTAVEALLDEARSRCERRGHRRLRRICPLLLRPAMELARISKEAGAC